MPGAYSEESGSGHGHGHVYVYVDFEMVGRLSQKAREATPWVLVEGLPLGAASHSIRS
jgi:hypothetical protein